LAHFGDPRQILPSSNVISFWSSIVSHVVTMREVWVLFLLPMTTVTRGKAYNHEEDLFKIQKDETIERTKPNSHPELYDS